MQVFRHVTGVKKGGSLTQVGRKLNFTVITAEYVTKATQV